MFFPHRLLLDQTATEQSGKRRTRAEVCGKLRQHLLFPFEKKVYIPNLSSHVQRCTQALAFDEQIVESVPVGEWDIKLDGVITPSGIIGSLENNL